MEVLEVEILNVYVSVLVLLEIRSYLHQRGVVPSKIPFDIELTSLVFLIVDYNGAVYISA